MKQLKTGVFSGHSSPHAVQQLKTTLSEQKSTNRGCDECSC